MNLSGIVSEIMKNAPSWKNAPWVAIPAAVLAALPKLTEVWNTLFAFRDVRRKIELERIQLENLKLRVEIESLKKQNGVTLDADAEMILRSLPSDVACRKPILAAAEARQKKKQIWNWLQFLSRKWPQCTSFSVSLLWILCSWLGIFLILSGLLGLFGAAISVLVNNNSNTTAGADNLNWQIIGWALLGAVVGFLLPGYMLAKIGGMFKAQGKLLKATQQAADAGLPSI